MRFLDSVRHPGSLGMTVGLAMMLFLSVSLAQQPGDGKKDSKATASQQERLICERLLAARKEYQATLEALRIHYMATHQDEKARWAEDELIQYHRIAKQAYMLGLDIPPPTLKPEYNIPAANELYRRAMSYKEKGWGTEYTDNQHRAELLLQQLLSNYPQCDKISDAAYQLGDIYEGKTFKQYARAAGYFEVCYQWNPHTHFDARSRAARIYDRILNDRSKAREIYQLVLEHETDQKRRDEAQRRIDELGARR
jgi:Tetratricopeptide repeat